MEMISKWMQSKTVAQIVNLFVEADIPCGPVQDPEMLEKDSHLKLRMFESIPHPKYGKVDIPGIPIKLSETPGDLKWACPMIGEHNQEIFSSWLGYSSKKIASLRKERII